MGILIFSRFSAYLILDVLKIGFYLPEILAIPFIPFLIKRYNKIKFKNKMPYLLLAAISILFLIILAVFNNTGDLKSILGTSRGFIYIIIFALIGKNLKTLFLDEIFAISLGSVTISFIWLFLMKSDISSVYYVSLNCIFLCAIIPLLRKKYFLFSTIMAMIIYIGIFSALRRVLFVLLIALVLGLLIDFWRSRPIKKIIPISFILVFYFISEYFLGKIIVLLSQNEYVFQRIIIKTTKSLEGEGSKGDNFRVGMIESLPEYFNEFLFPHGFSGNEMGKSMDVPLKEIIFIFGSILTSIFLIIIVVRLINILHNVKKNNPLIIYITPFTIILLLSFLFYDGGFLIWQYNTIFTGLFIGCFFNKKIEVK
ncbi:hypothetical protein OAC80_05450 [Flavobacteriaceae bacterium]|nr:hypothetical protein [Flavobacteriaceae bacterium]